MKKLTLIFFALLLAGAAFPQDKKLYISISPGIGLPTTRTWDLYYDGYEGYAVGLGKGLNVNLHAGYFLSSIIAVDLGITYRMGFGTKLDIKEYETPTKLSSFNAGTMKYKSNMLQIVPGIVISPIPESSSIRPYARAGIIIGLMPSIIEKGDVYADAGKTVNNVSTFKYSGGLAFGGHVAVGCDFNLNEMLSIFAEVFFNGINYTPTKGEYSKYETNGVDQLADWPTKFKEYSYVKDRTDWIENQPNNEPTQQIRITYPMSNAGLNFGVKINL